MITNITSGGKLIALLVDTKDIQDGTHPITDSAHALQILMMRRPKGHVFAKHTHALLKRHTDILQEAIVVLQGAVKITVCLRDGTGIGDYTVSTGQCLMLVDGGYTIEVLDDAVFFEFKNGPHEDDKVLL